MPKTFKQVYVSIRYIIDCTELFMPETIIIVNRKLIIFASYVTYKGLISISLGESVSLISQLFDGSISDRDIVSRSGFLKPFPGNSQDSVMADRGKNSF